jgi:hypothetical protein
MPQKKELREAKVGFLLSPERLTGLYLLFCRDFCLVASPGKKQTIICIPGMGFEFSSEIMVYFYNKSNYYINIVPSALATFLRKARLVIFSISELL